MSTQPAYISWRDTSGSLGPPATQDQQRLARNAFAQNLAAQNRGGQRRKPRMQLGEDLFRGEWALLFSNSLFSCDFYERPMTLTHEGDSQGGIAVIP
mgnify:CR=1 FL=1